MLVCGFFSCPSPLAPEFRDGHACGLFEKGAEVVRMDPHTGGDSLAREVRRFDQIDYASDADAGAGLPEAFPMHFFKNPAEVASIAVYFR